MTLPAEITIVGEIPPPSPNELRELDAIAPAPLDELLDDAADRLQVAVWLTLRRRGFRASWLDAGEIRVNIATTDDDAPA